jgi:hypothetical protein
MAHACIKETAYSITPCPKIMAIRQELHLYSHHHLDLEKCAMAEQVFLMSHSFAVETHDPKINKLESFVLMDTLSLVMYLILSAITKVG